MMFLHPRYAWIRQLAAFAVLLAVWEAAGRAGLLNPLYVPNPSRIGAALVELFSDGRIWPHLEATFTAALGGRTGIYDRCCNKFERGGSRRSHQPLCRGLSGDRRPGRCDLKGSGGRPGNPPGHAVFDSEADAGE